MKQIPKTIMAASALAGLGLLLTLLIQFWFTPVLLTLFFGVALPCCAAGVLLYVWAVYRDALRPKLQNPPNR
jgi:hypothetical protein